MSLQDESDDKALTALYGLLLCRLANSDAIIGF